MDQKTEAQSSTKLTERVLKGTVWTILAQALPLIVSFICTPIVIRLAGTERYGILVLLNVIPQYLLFTDLGMVMASTKFGSEAFSTGDLIKEARIVRTAAVYSMAISIPAAILVVIFSEQIAVFLGIPDTYIHEASLAIKLTAPVVPLYNLSCVFNSPQLARLRMDLNMAATIAYRLVAIIGIPLALYAGYGIVGAATVTLIAGVVHVTAQVALSYHLLPELLGVSIDRSSINPMLKFGSLMAFASVAAMLIANLEKGALSALSSVSELAHYAVGMSLANPMIILSTSMMQSLIPTFSQLQNQREQLNLLFGRCVRMVFILAVPAIVMLGIVAKTFISYWAGAEFGEYSTVPLYILLCALPLCLITYVPTSQFIASGRTDIMVRIFWLELPVYALILWFLIPRYGAIGAAIAYGLRISMDSAIQFLSVKRLFGISIPLHQWLSGSLALLIAAAPLLAHIFLGLPVYFAIAAAIPCLALYALFLWKTVLSDNEVVWIKSTILQRFGRSVK